MFILLRSGNCSVTSMRIHFGSQPHGKKLSCADTRIDKKCFTTYSTNSSALCPSMGISVHLKRDLKFSRARLAKQTKYLPANIVLDCFKNTPLRMKNSGNVRYFNVILRQNCKFQREKTLFTINIWFLANSGQFLE